MIENMRYLRMSLTSGCNLNCFYCRPSSEKTATTTMRSLDQCQSALKLLCRLGINKVRFTGGEPTLNKHLPDLIQCTRQLNRENLTAITTNGMLLKRLSPSLASAGLDSANISLDTINRDKFKKITGIDGLDKVIEGIDAAIDHIEQVKLNCVVIKGVNDDELEKLAHFAGEREIDIRFIEYMPTKHNSRDSRGYLSGDDVRSSLPFDLVPAATNPSSAAQYYFSPELNIRVGFINPVSHSFCALCDRIRLASDGRLYGCLFSGDSVNLFSLLDQSFEYAEERISRLIADKQYLGCPGTFDKAASLPSFIEMGG